jgi:Ti-type conjugative transfer relaxase TraA
MVPRISIGRGITGVCQYVLGEGRGAGNDNVPADEESRVAWIGGQNFGFDINDRDDADLARRIMEFDALNQGSRTRRCEKDAVHLVLAWRVGEIPTREEMEDAVRGALKALGMDNAKAIWVTHRDEDHAHLHIVASKINPATGLAYDLKRNYLKLSRWAQKYEREHGGTVCLRRERANELRDAIDRRDAKAVLEAITRQRATFTAADLDRALGKQILERLARAQFGNGVLDHADVVRLSDHKAGPTTRYTTRTVLEAEQYVLQAAKSLAGDNAHALDYRTLGHTADRTRDHGKALGPDQMAVLYHATKESGLVLIDGQGGTGKSHAMNAVREAYEAEGHRVIGTSWTNVIVQKMVSDGFANTSTVKSELTLLANGRQKWDERTVVMVDEATMIDTQHMALLTAHAREAGAKLILIGDDRQLSSIDRGGMFGALKDEYGAAELTELRRHHKDEDRRAASMMAEGNFADALAIYQEKELIHWTRTQSEARSALVEQWTKDSAAQPDKSRFVFAYTNADVANLNADIRVVKQGRGELGPDQVLQTADGQHAFATGDRVQFTGTDKARGLYNGAVGTVQTIDGGEVTVKLDGRKNEEVRFDVAEFDQLRHGYAGTIYKGQGRTLDQTYLHHSEHWRSAASYVALTRHRDKAELFVATNTTRDLTQLARQMARVDERRAASNFHQQQDAVQVRALTAKELQVEFFGRPQQPEPTATRQAMGAKASLGSHAPQAESREPQEPSRAVTIARAARALSRRHHTNTIACARCGVDPAIGANQIHGNSDSTCWAWCPKGPQQTLQHF